MNAVARDAIDEHKLGTLVGTPLAVYNGALHALRDGVVSWGVFGFWSLSERQHFSDFECSNVIGMVSNVIVRAFRCAA